MLPYIIMDLPILKTLRYGGGHYGPLETLLFLKVEE